MGKFVYRNEESMRKMHTFYDKVLASLDVEYSSFCVDTSYGNTHIITVGDTTKKPVFTLHGGNGINPLNIQLFSPLLDEYYFIAPDVIGMPGKSEPYRNINPKKDDYANWINEVLIQLKIDNIMFVVSSYSASMMLSFATSYPEKISKAVLLKPSGIAHGPMLPIIWNMSIPFIKYYFRPSPKTLKGIMDSMVGNDDDIWREFLDLMMSSYKMEMRAPREYEKDELINFTAPLFIIASPNDIFFPAGVVFSKADKIFAGKLTKMEVLDKHLPSQKTMVDVCRAIVDFDKSSTK